MQRNIAAVEPLVKIGTGGLSALFKYFMPLSYRGENSFKTAVIKIGIEPVVGYKKDGHEEITLKEAFDCRSFRTGGDRLCITANLIAGFVCRFVFQSTRPYRARLGKLTTMCVSRH